MKKSLSILLFLLACVLMGYASVRLFLDYKNTRVEVLQAKGEPERIPSSEDIAEIIFQNNSLNAYYYSNKAWQGLRLNDSEADWVKVDRELNMDRSSPVIPLHFSNALGECAETELGLKCKRGKEESLYEGFEQLSPTEKSTFYVKQDSLFYTVYRLNPDGSSRKVSLETKGHFYNPYYSEKNNTLFYQGISYMAEKKLFQYKLLMQKGNAQPLAIPLFFDESLSLEMIKVADNKQFIFVQEKKSDKASVMVFNQRYYPFRPSALGLADLRLGSRLNFPDLLQITSFDVDDEHLYLVARSHSQPQRQVYTVELKTVWLANQTFWKLKTFVFLFIIFVSLFVLWFSFRLKKL